MKTTAPVLIDMKQRLQEVLDSAALLSDHYGMLLEQHNKTLEENRLLKEENRLLKESAQPTRKAPTNGVPPNRPVLFTGLPHDLEEAFQKFFEGKQQLEKNPNTKIETQDHPQPAPPPPIRRGPSIRLPVQRQEDDAQQQKEEIAGTTEGLTNPPRVTVVVLRRL